MKTGFFTICVLAVFGCVACNKDDQDVSSAFVDAVSSQAELSTTDWSSLKDKLDVAGNRIIMAVDRPVGNVSYASPAQRLAALKNNVSVSTGETWGTENATMDKWSGETSSLKGKFFYGRNLIVVRDKERGYESQEVKSFDETELLQESGDVLKGVIGVDEEVIRKYAVKLVAWDNEKGKSDAEEREVARKVFYHRGVGGVEIAGDRVVVSYAKDGSLRKILGMWRQIDWESSKLTSDKTEQDVVDMAMEEIKLSGALPDEISSFSVSTLLVPEYDESRDVYTLVLKGLVNLRQKDNHGNVTRSQIDFEI